MTLWAAYKRDCLSAGLPFLAAVFLFFATGSSAAGQAQAQAQAPSPSSESTSKKKPRTPRPSASPAYAIAAPAGSESVLSRDVPRVNNGGGVTQERPAGTYVVVKIDFIGNRRVRNDTLRARIFTREGDTYNEETLKRDFQALWNTQFFEDVKLRVEDSPGRTDGKLIIFELKERPTIRRILYVGNHSVSESDILDRFKERKVGLSVESQFDPTRIKKAEVVLKDLLGEHGRQYAKVIPQYERIAASNAVILTFKIDEGPKVKVGQLRFTGNKSFSDRKLIRAMRHSRPFAIPMYFANIAVMSKTFDREKLNEDLEVGVRGLYQDNGFFKVLVKDPIIENVDIDKRGLPLPGLRNKHGKAVNLTIPIEEGDRYHMGKLNVISADPEKALSLKVEPLKEAFPLKAGDLFAVGKIRKALEDYRKIYGQFGFIDFTAEPETEVDEEAKRINLTLRFNEEKQYYVRRIEFSGNTTTRDKVIRRQLLVEEGSVFNQRAWEVSILRLNQLDYFNRIKAEDAALARNSKEGTVDIDLKLKEKGKQSIGLQGGVSGLAGSFIGLTYQTNNFLGLGETLTFSAQFGDRQRSFVFGFTEPYLFDRPISSGFTVFTSRFSYNQAREESILLGQQVNLAPQNLLDYNQNSTGFTLFASYPIRRFSFTRLGVTYGLSKTDITTFNAASQLLFQTVQFRSLAGPAALSGILSSTITPTLTYNRIDNPINPTTGQSFFYSFSFQGGPLGGNVNAISNIFEYKKFRPIRKKRNVIGYRVQASYIRSFGGLELPPFSRFYMGGEDTVRGFDIRAISPVTFIPVKSSQSFTFLNPFVLDGAGNPTIKTLQIPILTYQTTFPGGDLQGVANFEYRIPIVGSIVSMAFFADVGANGIVNRSGLQLPSNSLQDLLTTFPPGHTFPATNLTSQLSLAPGTNFKPRVSTGIELVVQIPIVQAPFRIYYAYNASRLRQQIMAPNNVYNKDALNNLCASLLVPGVCQNEILPQLNSLTLNPGRLNYFEPTHTFRFTVSRTF
jgi:outer membrane protein insertion porin family